MRQSRTHHSRHHYPTGQEAAPFVQIAIPVVELIVKMTPTLADDAILAACEHYNYASLFQSNSDPKVVLRDLAVQVIREQVKDPVATQVLNTAVELALGVVRKQAAAIPQA